MMQILIEKDEYDRLMSLQEQIYTLRKQQESFSEQLKNLKAFTISQTSPLEDTYREQTIAVLVDLPDRMLPLKRLWKELRDKNDHSRDLTGTDNAAKIRRSRILKGLRSRPDIFKIWKPKSVILIKLIA